MSRRLAEIEVKFMELIRAKKKEFDTDDLVQIVELFHDVAISLAKWVDANPERKLDETPKIQ